MSKIAIYVSSFDGYSDLWDVFFQIFFKYWPNCEYNIYLINNEKEYSFNDVKIINTGKEVNWYTRTLRSLESIDEEYILFLLEDYFFSKHINKENIEEIIETMDNEKSFVYYLSERKDIILPSIIEKNIKITTPLRYAISLQPAIWKKDKLIELLHLSDGNSPWDFEYYFDNDFPNKEQLLRAVRYDSRDLLGYKNGVLRGKWIPATLKFYKKQGIILDNTKRNKMSVLEDFKYKLAVFVSLKLSREHKTVIKKLLKKINIKYL